MNEPINPEPARGRPAPVNVDDAELLPGGWTIPAAGLVA
ncbi:hypothetical protein ABIB38_000927 [Massilia sp. UYP11]